MKRSSIFLYGAYASGWGLLLFSTFLLNHFELFGLRQVWLQLTGKPYQPLPFRTPVLYRHVRHPLYIGWLCAFWAAPTMTVAHLVFALFEPDRNQDVGAGREREQQMRDRHGRCGPECTQPADVQRVTYVAVEDRRTEGQGLVPLAGKLQPHLAQTEQVEMIEQER